MCMKFQWHNDDNDGDADDIHSLLTWIPIQITVLKNYLNFENICHNVRNEVRYALKNIMGLFVIFFKCQSPTPPFCKLEYVVIYAFLVLVFLSVLFKLPFASLPMLGKIPK